MYIQVIDSLMGTGKSTYMIERLNGRLREKFIILVPLLTEVTRYKEAISSDYVGKRSDVVALDTDEKLSKTTRFMDAVAEDKTVIATHKLFTYLGKDELKDFKNIGEYNLVIDETIVLVGKRSVKSTDLKALVDDAYIEAIEHPKLEGLYEYRMTGKGTNYILEEGEVLSKVLRSVSGRHVYRVSKTTIVFVVPPEKLTSFKHVELLTYLFDGSETHGWIQLFGILYGHLGLIDNGYGHLVTVLHSCAHTGCAYTGAPFKLLLKIHDEKINDIGVKRKGANTPLTKTWFTKRNRSHKDIKQLRNNTRTFFRTLKADKKQMLWTCFKDYKEWLRDSRFDPKRGSVVTWIQQGERGTNLYADRTFLAYLVDVYPPVELSQFFWSHRIRFDEDRFALSRVLQWVWRAAIRNHKKVTLYLPSERMRKLVEDWLR